MTPKEEVKSVFPYAGAGYIRSQDGPSGYVITAANQNSDLIDVLCSKLSDTATEAWAEAYKNKDVKATLATKRHNEAVEVVTGKYPNAIAQYNVHNGCTYPQGWYIMLNGRATATYETAVGYSPANETQAWAAAAQTLKETSDKRCATDHAFVGTPIVGSNCKGLRIAIDQAGYSGSGVSDMSEWVNLEIPKPWFLYSLEQQYDMVQGKCVPNEWLCKLKNPDGYMHRVKGKTAQEALNKAVSDAKAKNARKTPPSSGNLAFH